MKISVKNFMAGVLILMLSTSAMAGQGKTQRVEVLDKLVSIEMPESFKAIKIPDSEAKKLSHKIRPEVYINETNAANFVFSYTYVKQKGVEEQLNGLAMGMSKALEKYSPKISRLEINGQPALLIDYVAPNKNGDIHSLYLAMSIDDCLFIAVFSIPEAQAPKSLAAGREALLSIQVNKK